MWRGPRPRGQMRTRTRTDENWSRPMFSASEDQVTCCSPCLRRWTLNSSDGPPHFLSSGSFSGGSRRATYIGSTTNLHLPSLRAAHAILHTSSLADVDSFAEHDCTPQTPSRTDNIPTHTESQHYNRLCASAGIRPDEEEAQMPKAKCLAEIAGVGMSPEKLERYSVGLPPAVTKPKSQCRSRLEPRARTNAKSKGEARGKPVLVQSPLQFVLIDQIMWNEDLSWETLFARALKAGLFARLGRPPHSSLPFSNQHAQKKLQPDPKTKRHSLPPTRHQSLSKAKHPTHPPSCPPHPRLPPPRTRLNPHLHLNYLADPDPAEAPHPCLSNPPNDSFLPKLFRWCFLPSTLEGRD
ncbi:hypothetical protein BDV93DRAFT_160637 [Ceratobasidium sp. AG-I]|nr:hypothetical protein BDV93DRAFT_160637 [Ceratobasidium sp. AG-I]